MDLHQLRCFMAVVNEGGFNRATGQLHITQPALSYQIKQLEGALGVRLFHRRPGGVSPTEAGRVLFQHAQKVMQAVRKAQQAVEELAEGVVGEIRIGTINSVGIYFLPEVLWSMREKYPRTKPTVLYRHSNEIMEALLANQIDIAVVANPAVEHRLTQETVIEEQVSLVCGRAHPFFGKKKIAPSALKGLQFVAPSPESPTGKLIGNYLDRLGVDVEPVVSSDNVETVKKMVEVGLGVAFLPNMVTSRDISCEGQPAGRLARIKVGPPLTRRIVMVTWKHFEMTKAVKAFVEELKQHGEQWRDCLEAPGIEC